ncbi:MAG: MmcQ/YjbR family DNA-binding protein [Pseudomonadota bacterium]
MKRDRFDAICVAMTGAHNVIQWGDASVWKVGGAKGPVFAIHSHWGPVEGVVLKPSEMAREIWRDAPGVALAPYLGRAGWIKIDEGAMGEGDLIALIEGSYAINAGKLTKKARAELGIPG